MREERRSPNLLLTVIVPAYNEAATVEVALRRVRAVPLRLQIIVVNDASTDGTREILDGLGKQGLVDRVIHHDANRGTLFLHNIAEAPTRVQARLARVLRDREATPDSKGL